MNKLQRLVQRLRAKGAKPEEIKEAVTRLKEKK